MREHRKATLPPAEPSIIRRHGPILVVSFSFLVVVTAVLPPTGNAFMTDDWDFSASVFHWEQTGRLTLSDFPSMTLIGHLACGRLFVKAFGCEPSVLRAATLTMTWLAAILLYWLARKDGVTSTVASLLAGSVLFQPLFFFFSYTFLTDVTGCLWTLLIAATFQIPAVRASLLSKTPNHRTLASLFAICLLATVVSTAYLVRQTATIPAMAAAILLVPALTHRRIRRFNAVLVIALTSIPVIAFWIWIEHLHGIPLNYQKMFLQIDLLTQPKILIAKLLLIAMTLGLYLAPISVYGLLIQPLQTSASIIGNTPRPVDRTRAVVKRFLLACSVGTFVASAFWILPPLRTIRPLFGIHPHDPDLGNLPPVLGLREHLYSPILFSIGRQSVTRWEFLTLPAACISISICLWLVWRSRARILESCLRTLRGDWPDSCQILATSLVGQLILLLFVRDVFDRYLMPLFILALPLFFPVLRGQIPAITSGDNESLFRLPQLSRCATLMLALSLGVMGVCSIIWTRDRRIEWQIAWETGEQLQKETNQIDWLQLGQPYYGDKIYRPALQRQLALHDHRLKNIPRSLRTRLLQQRPHIGYILVVQGHETSQLGDATRLRTLDIPTWCKPTKWDLYHLGTSPAE